MEEKPKAGAFFSCSDLRDKSDHHKAARVEELKLALEAIPPEARGRLAARRRSLIHSISILAK